MEHGHHALRHPPPRDDYAYLLNTNLLNVVVRGGSRTWAVARVMATLVSQNEDLDSLNRDRETRTKPQTTMEVVWRGLTHSHKSNTNQIPEAQKLGRAVVAE